MQMIATAIDFGMVTSQDQLDRRITSLFSFDPQSYLTLQTKDCCSVDLTIGPGLIRSLNLALFDVLRRANSGRLVQDQAVPMLDVGIDKWADLRKKLAEDEGPEAHFENVFLIDDFTTSGTTFIRQSGEGHWKGRLKKFNDLVCKAPAWLTLPAEIRPLRC
jgi:hypothetical protein